MPEVPDPPLVARILLMVGMVPIFAPPVWRLVGQRDDASTAMRPWNWVVLVAFGLVAVVNVARWTDPRSADLGDAEAALTWFTMAVLALSYGLTLVRALRRRDDGTPPA